MKVSIVDLARIQAAAAGVAFDRAFIAPVRSVTVEVEIAPPADELHAAYREARSTP